MMKQIAPRVAHLNLLASNAYLVGDKSQWVVVDSGMPGNFDKIRLAAEAMFGTGSRPEAIILTHGHVDHYGSALGLAAYWDVPVYAHRLDHPYLSGKDEMPPLDPTVGGFFAFVARFLPKSGTDLGNTLMSLPEDGNLPGMPGWVWHHTPGHTPGHISLWREEDRTLLAGDAIITTDLDNAATALTFAQKLAIPPSPGTYDWVEARQSISHLADLRPYTIAAGHGIPMSGPDLAGKLKDFADYFIAPLHGRYIPEPARFNEQGVAFLPPPQPDPLPAIALGLGAAALVGMCIYTSARQKRKDIEG